MEPLRPRQERDAPACNKCGKPIVNLKDHDNYVAQRVGFAGNWEYTHTACLSPRESQELLENLR